LTFRADINVLRAIAVTAVVLFHFNIPGFTGGFTGVDIFFVISGYLMTGIIFTQLNCGKFSLTDFYIARARRIIPAFAALIIVVTTILWWFLPPSELIKLAKQITSGIAFFSNIYFLNDSGYFDSNSHEKWLLHSWSLSVEWQFYLLYPVALVVTKKFLPTLPFHWLVLLAALFSFSLSAFLPDRWSDAGFYLLPTRAWEMLAGALIFLFPGTSQQNSRIYTALGLLLIGYSVIFISPTNHWPGWKALIPVMGTCLIIYGNNPLPYLTDNRVVQYLGKISYSLYLWHWPVFVGIAYIGAEKNSLWIWGGIALSILLASISYFVIEIPITKRRAPKISSPTLFSQIKISSIYILSCTAIALIGTSIQFLNGIPSRLDASLVHIDKERYNRNPRSECDAEPGSNNKPKECVFGGNGNSIGLIVVGDSHASATINAVAAAFTDSKGILYLGANGCPYISNIQTKYFPTCDKYNQIVANIITKQYPGTPVMVINRATATLSGENETEKSSLRHIEGTSSNSQSFSKKFKKNYTSTMCTLAQNRKVYILNPIPEIGKNVPAALIKNRLFSNDDADIGIDLAEYKERHSEMIALNNKISKNCHIELLDPTTQLCDKKKCWGSADGMPLYYDDDHLSEYGNRYLVPLFSKINQTLLL